MWSAERSKWNWKFKPIFARIYKIMRWWMCEEFWRHTAGWRWSFQGFRKFWKSFELFSIHFWVFCLQDFNFLIFAIISKALRNVNSSEQSEKWEKKKEKKALGYVSLLIFCLTLVILYRGVNACKSVDFTGKKRRLTSLKRSFRLKIN